MNLNTVHEHDWTFCVRVDTLLVNTEEATAALIDHAAGDENQVAGFGKGKHTFDWQSGGHDAADAAYNCSDTYTVLSFVRRILIMKSHYQPEWQPGHRRGSSWGALS
jgi:hypothetical protein